jgi:Mg-chelatase subunit ChlD
MRQESTKTLRTKRKAQGGFAALFVVFLAGTLATLSWYTVKFGRTSLRVSTEKQLLDTHGHLLGQQLIKQGPDAVCQGGHFQGDLSQISSALFGQLDTAEEDEREYRCEELGTVTRDQDTEEGPAGSYRRYRVTSSYDAGYYANDPDAEEAKTDRSVIVEVREISGEVERPRPQIMFLLDYSGSMSSNNRMPRLKSAVDRFIDKKYDVDYGVVFFSSDVLETIGLGSGGAHDDNVSRRVNERNPGGSTNFTDPLRTAVQQLEQMGNHYSYIVLVSDGNPNAGGDPVQYVNQNIRDVDPEICRTRRGNRPCHTVYTLGVDDANMSTLERLSGNRITPSADRGDFTYEIASEDIIAAFDDITKDILCSFGPIDPAPEPDEEDSIHVFFQDAPLELSPDGASDGFIYDRNTNSVKLYGEPCEVVFRDDSLITIRYGKPRVIAE